MTICSRDDIEPATIELFTVNQVASAMQVSKMTVYRLIRADALRAVRVDGSLRLYRDSVEAYLCAAMRMRSRVGEVEPGRSRAGRPPENGCGCGDRE